VNLLETSGFFTHGVEVDGGVAFFLVLARERNLVLFMVPLARTAPEVEALLPNGDIFGRKHDPVRYRFRAQFDAVDGGVVFSERGVSIGVSVDSMPTTGGLILAPPVIPARDVVLSGFRFFLVEPKSLELLACGTRLPP